MKTVIAFQHTYTRIAQIFDIAEKHGMRFSEGQGAAFAPYRLILGTEPTEAFLVEISKVQTVTLVRERPKPRTSLPA